MQVEDLSPQVQEQLQRILDDDIKVVSFDIFDTLLLRPVTHPQDVWRLVGKIADIPFFREKRRIAEEKTKNFLEFPNEDCTIFEIYDTYARLFQCTAEEAYRLAQLEMDVELDLLYPRATAQCIYNEVKKAGKEIIIVTDMYLPSDFLRKLLDKNGYTGYSKLYVSGEEKIKKGSGSLYRRIIEDYSEHKVLPREIVHIGDNLEVDIKRAQKAGIKAVFLEKPLDVFLKKKYLKPYLGWSHQSMDNSFLYGILINLFFDDPLRPFRGDSRYNSEIMLLGYTVSPFLISFFLWMMREAERDGIEQFAFVYRDGYLPEKIYEIMKPFLPHFEIIPLHLARAIRLGHFAKDANSLFDSIYSNKFDEKMKVGDFISKKMLVTDEDEFNEVMNIFIKGGYTGPDVYIGRKEDFVSFLHRLDPYFKRNAEERIKLCDDYIKGLIDPSKKLGIFDAGYRGSASRFLEKQYGLTNIEYNIMVIPDVELNKKKLNDSVIKYYIYFDERKKNRLNVPGHNISLTFLEDILCEPLPTVSKLIRTETGIGVIREKASESSEAQIRTQDSVLAFTRLFADLFGKYLSFLEFDRHGPFDIFMELLIDPNRRDAEIIRKFNHKDPGHIGLGLNYYESWYNKAFPTTQKKVSSLKEKAIFAGKLIAEKLHMTKKAQSIYLFAREVFRYSFRPPSLQDEILAQLDKDVKALKRRITATDNIVLFIGEVHPSAYKILNTMADAMTKNNWIFLTTNNIRSKLTFSSYYLPQTFSDSYDPGFVKISKSYKKQIKNNEPCRLTAEQMRMFRPKFSNGYPEFITQEIEKYYCEAFQHIDPNLIIIWNPNHVPNIIINSIARRLKIPVVYMETGALPGTMCIDKDGIFGESMVAREPEQFLVQPLTAGELDDAEDLIRYFRDTGANRYVQSAGEEFFNALAQIDKSRPTLFFAGDYDPDSGHFPHTEHAKEFHSPIFGTTRDAVLHLAKLAEKNGWNLVFKPHPLSDRWNIESDLPENVICFKKGDINALVDASDLTISICSSVSYTALIREKPALTIGYTQLKSKGCAYEAFSLDAIESTIKEALEQGHTEEQRKAFIKHVAQMNKYYLFDNMINDGRPVRYGKTVEEAMQYLESMIKKEEST